MVDIKVLSEMGQKIYRLHLTSGYVYVDYSEWKELEFKMKEILKE